MKGSNKHSSLFHLKIIFAEIHSYGWLLALPANIRLGRKRMTATNALAYFGTELIMALKRFIV